jgi:L-fuculose-phosphate aldolase
VTERPTNAAPAALSCPEDGPPLRRQLIHVARTTIARGLNVNKSGNVSARCLRGGTEGLLITPTAIAYHDLAEQDLVFVSLSEGRCSGTRAPSSEWRFHLGTQDLSDYALAALSDRKACLLRNHGCVACGADLPNALAIAQEVEHLAHIYLLAQQLGEPLRLTEAQMASVIEQFRTSYGQR